MGIGSIATDIVGIPSVSFDCREVHCSTRVHENPNIALDIIRTSEQCLHLYTVRTQCHYVQATCQLRVVAVISIASRHPSM